MSNVKRSLRNRKKRGAPSRELQWLATHPEIFSLYPEQWIAIANNAIVAHGRKLSVVANKAYEKARKPLFFLVPSEKLLAL